MVLSSREVRSLRERRHNSRKTNRVVSGWRSLSKSPAGRIEMCPFRAVNTVRLSLLRWAMVVTESYGILFMLSRNWVQTADPALTIS